MSLEPRRTDKTTHTDGKDTYPGLLAFFKDQRIDRVYGNGNREIGSREIANLHYNRLSGAVKAFLNASVHKLAEPHYSGDAVDNIADQQAGGVVS